MRSRVATLITTAIILAALASCGSPEIKRPTETPEQILSRAMGQTNLHPGRVSTLPGADRSDLPYVPVVTPPEIARIWIYDHVTPSNDLVVGHWIFVRLKEERWYIEDQWGDSPTQQQGNRKLPLPPSTETLSAPTGEATPSQPPPLGAQIIGTPSEPPAQGLTPLPPQGGK